MYTRTYHTIRSGVFTEGSESDIDLSVYTAITPFPHTAIMQQTTSKIFCQNIEYLYNWMDNLWLKMENIVSKGEIARFEQFLVLSLCFQKAVESVFMRERVK